ncbi:MFS monosaccharide transporter-like protein [Aureobasidium melanogenum CBS 110374]|uniref:MFS monosaccharide transporter-like protein n=1 Tax=Aureobasidium melanogenum (strain CBS 110374) TaxID=1043003 RepID=A0A074W285_AURM1|nr:MFS monosaccharide transporter-like protein [Aureobasidium melanogenum CBS 110374]KEQ67210.1 MFS monosaccharide transporter-like protein [Aureobasidium melanogenum CBS 110374]
MSMSGGGFDSRSSVVFSVTVAMITCSTVFVFSRIASRAGIVKKVLLDDYFILVAWLLAFGLSFSICYGSFVGLGRHEDDVPDSWQGALRRSQYAFSVLYNPALMAEKTSILVFYLTLSKTNMTFRWATIATLFVVNAAGLALTLVTLFQCNPVGAAFRYPVPATHHCTDIITIYLSSAPVNIITDLAILFLPMPILTSMRLPRKQKTILVITFGFGLFVAVVDIVRIAYLQSASTYRLNQILNFQQDNSSGRDVDVTDFSWYASYSFMWSAIEVNVGIMCACVPALKPLVSRFMPHLLRDEGDVTEKHSSVDRQPTFEMATAQRVPSMQDPAYLTTQPSREPVEDSNMDMMDFLTTPDMQNSLERSQTMLTNSTRNTSADTPTFFDFVNLKNRKSFVQMTVRESLFPVIMVTVLFFIWGFEYGLLDVLNRQFQRVAHMSSAQSVGIHSAYYAGYFFGPLTFGRLALKHYGFKACYIIGLSIYACGILIFWPAAVLTSFPAFVIVNFIVGLGLSTLEISANPFISLCGPMQYVEVRLNLSQGFQAIGTVVAPLIAQKALFGQSHDAPSLINTQWAYLGIALFTVALAVAFFYVPLPEATDKELEDACERMDNANHATVGKFRVIWYTLAVGAFAMFCYVGAQEVLATTFDGYLALVAPSFNETNYMAIGHALFAVSRFVAAGAGFVIKPRLLLVFFLTGTLVFAALAMNFTGSTATAMMLMVFFFEGPLFSLIFAQSIRGMGKFTKEGSVILIAAVSGGGVFPGLSYVAKETHNSQYAMCVAVAGFAGATLLPFYLNYSPLARTLCDPLKDPSEMSDESLPGSSNSSVASRALSFFSIRKKSAGEMKTEWHERQASADSSASPGAYPSS